MDQYGRGKVQSIVVAVPWTGLTDGLCSFWPEEVQSASEPEVVSAGGARLVVNVWFSCILVVIDSVSEKPYERGAEVKRKMVI